MPSTRDLNFYKAYLAIFIFMDTCIKKITPRGDKETLLEQEIENRETYIYCIDPSSLIPCDFSD
jgi:hypothetical protein